MAQLTREDRCLIEYLWVEKNLSALRMMQQFPESSRLLIWEALQQQIGQNLMDKAIDQWLGRISLVIRAKRGHIEHRLD